MNEPLSLMEQEQLVRLARKYLASGIDVQRSIQDQKINIVSADFYSNTPTVRDIENSFEYGESDGPFRSPSLFNDERLKCFIEDISAYSHEFNPPVSGDNRKPVGYFWENPSFSWSDAMAYYTIIRHFKPSRILEVGSGFSTLVALSAFEKNGGGEIWCVEPFPHPLLKKRQDHIKLVEEPVQNLRADFFNSILADGDILFIDSTHTVKSGSDCLHLYLRILPGLVNDVYVHAHDICLPYPMPKKRVLEKHRHWTEQYLLYAYLLDNPKVEVLFGSFYNKFRFPELMRKFMDGKCAPGGGSFWFHLLARKQ
jgi:hypothetical protein